MQVHQYNVEDLLCNYLYRFLFQCPFLKVKVEDSGVIISLGSESCNEDASDTYQEFFVYEKYEIKADIETLERLLKTYEDISCQKMSENDFLITMKREVILHSEGERTHQEENIFINFNEFMEYIKNNKRTILLVSKQRYLTASIEGAIMEFDSIPISRHNYVVAYVIGCIGPRYEYGSGVAKREFVVTREKVESLDKNTFKVYILKESEEEICYEIFNKGL